MLLVLIVLVVVGAGVSGTAPKLAPSRCPSPAERDACKPIECGPNSHFEKCSKVCPPQNCSALIDPYWLCESSCCIPECRCNDGYYRDDRTGQCISRDECLAQCGPLERFVKDSPECQRTCANYKVTGPRSLCKPFTGCVCADGRVRLNDNGTGPCVTPKECPRRQCPLHEHWEDCPSVCAKETCISRNPDFICLLPAIPLPCKPRCICDKGYLRNHLGHCIPKNHCPTKRCPINEVWRCASMCPRDSCKRLEKDFQCPPGIISVCIPACACKDGYLRNDKGICIPRELCPASLRCGINEVAVECKAYPPQTCESVYTLYKPIKNPPCEPGCDCRPGYLRNKRGICVPSEFCPTVPHCRCGPRQEYKECGTACEPSCAHLDNPPQICPEVCVKGCFCKDGYLKDENGNCVDRSECPLPICNKPNEVAKDCGSYCEIKTCEDYKRTDIVCPAVCVRGCFCRDGYVRNANGICIRPEKCPPKPVCLQENEEYQSCGSSCPDNCDNYMNPDRICTMNCVAGCNCKKGYVRNLKDNTCIKPEQCPTKQCTGVNEELNLCASYCPVTCANRFTLGDWACITLCREACECVSGTLRHDNGTCVSVEQCSPPVCRQNEKYMQCGTACPLTCDNYKTPPPCTRQCVEDCFCEDGYVRDRFARCVKPENCEPICPAGEKYNECSAHCQDTCENYNVTNRICTYQCQSGCVCEEGTVRRKDGKCVVPSECSPPICPAGEIYDACSAHCEPTCDHHEPNRPCTAICIPGCRCGDGLVRRSDGKCVKVERCPAPCPPSEHFDECNSHCEDTCESQGNNATICLPYCKAGCRCNDGLVRRKDGQCVNPGDCSATLCSADEVYDPCSAHCEPTCRSNGPDRVCAAYCEPGCRCKDGLVRRTDGKCVKVEDCPKNPQCGTNERWVECVLGTCIPLTCDQLGFPIACPDLIGPCDGGCICAENYVRDSNNTCIPQKDCPSCGNDFNATVGCGINCGRLCTNYKNPPNCAIPQYCQYNACDCKDGYVYDEVTERCVAPVDCPVPCNGDLYAEKVKCPNPCPATCAKPTTKVCSKACLKEGCQCRIGFVLNSDGKCVKPENCPADIGCNGDPNAHISSCVSLCQPTCGIGPIFCPAFCRLGCACNEGYKLSEPGGVCIKPEQCPNVTTTTTESPVTTTTVGPVKILCPNNEIWIDCKIAYCKPEYCRDINADRKCLEAADPCLGGCICKNGMLRNDDGVCIPKDQCSLTKPCSDPNAIRKKCASHESCRATCAVPNSRVCPKICIIDGCECKPGYVLSKKGGKCVRIEDCPQGNVTCNGDPNAVIMAFPPACPSTCDLPNGIPGCLKLGLDVGCTCKPGYILSDDNGKCILPDKCIGGNPCGANATFSWCRVNCPNNYCPVDDSRAIIACSPPYPCPSGCVCKLNYRRKSIDDDRCIEAATCPPVKCTRPNEIWDPCPSECRREYCEDVNNQPTTCNTLVLNCQPQCICKKGHFRNASDICIPAKDCPNNKPCDDPNAERLECAPAPSCRSTCAKPNPSPCITSCAVNECVCKKGYVLSEKGGKCIPVDQCPKDAPCNGDSNAVIKANPIPCPSTCAGPNASPWCKRYAPPVGCECRPGYILTEYDGKCIKPDDCPGGNPCGANSTFVWCAVSCPNDYCPKDDRRGLIACDPPYPCPSGCVCNLNYKRKSSDDRRCILSSTCPPVKCTRPNEVWDPCPSPCRHDNCADIKRDLFCKPLPLNCQPQCVCQKGYYRNDKDICVPEKECPINQPCDDPNAERLECAPAPICRSTCAKPVVSPCILSCAINECVCKQGYVLSAKGGTCIPVDQCPKDVPCNGDSNAVIKANPIPCPSTCSAPNASPWCKRYAPPIGCECKSGYLLAEDGGRCIKPDECPGGNPCGQNATFVECTFNCPTNYCPVTEGGPMIACSPPYPCPSGCACKKDYKRRSSSDYTCILAKECPPVIKQCSDPNAERVSCAPAKECRPTCDQRNPGPCIEICIIDDCVCKKGFILSEKDGKCIPEDQCPVKKECKDPNAERVTCGLNYICRATCAKPNPGPCLSQICIENDCVCKKGYVLSEQGGKCVAPTECPIQKSCNGDPNAQIKECPLPCPATCDAPHAIPCKKACVPIGCECKDGYILSETRGKCILPEKCKGGYPCSANETFVSCKVPCPTDYCPVNTSPNTVICETPNPCYPGCVCKINYRRRSVDDRRCMYASECPPLKCNKNEVWSGCPSDCLQEDCSDVNAPPVVCNTLLLNCQPKCICQKGYYRDSDRNCVPAKQCPKPIKCGANEIYKTCRIKCPPQTCASIYSSYDCRNATKCEPGCDCLPEYLRNGTDKDPCIPSEQCPTNQPPTQECGINEHYETNTNKCDLTCKNYEKASCKGCPTSSGCFCNDGYVRNTNGLCIPKKRCPQNIKCPKNEVLSECYTACHKTCKTRIRGDGRMCHTACIETGCLCVEGYLRHDNGTCVPISECSPPQCNANETYSACGTACPPTCQNRDDNRIACTDQCVEDCFCSKGYVRSDDGTCVKPKDCPSTKPCSDPNAIRKKCASHESCRATCAVPNSRVCPKICIIDGCECKPGYVLSEKGGKCVRIEDCPQGNVTCNGDPNAVIMAFPPACPSTCDLPNGIPGCLKLGLDVGCTCKPGYILSDDNGKCILPDKCKGGNPCGANATFSWCRVNCPNNYCPVDDSRAIIACDPPYPCPSGCVCKLNYRRKSVNDDRCIEAATCPPVKCTRPNEVWDPCPSECRRENCEDVNNQPTTCNTLVLNCQPQCVCKKGHFRNASDICIPAKDCPNNKPCDDPNAERLECAPAPSCRSTCAKPNPSPCIKSCAVNECVCKKGYVLSEKGGKCIPVDQCPKDAPCNGDSNAVIKANPIPCPSTCAGPDASPWCKRYAPPVGCECRPGYILTEYDGKCIKPDDCPGGNPCGVNATFVWCAVSCPNDYCPKDDRRGLIACDPPYPCPSGCICNLNYKRKSSDDRRCILSSTCPPVKCTRPNEVWDPCPSPCRHDNCADIKRDLYCKPLPLNCQPQCVCQKGYYRNDKDICVPEKECPINQPCNDANAERLECAPAPICRSTCAKPVVSPCILSCAINECVCKQGYVLAVKDGPCIPVDQCPKDEPCNGDSNAVIKANPIPCPSTCSAPNASPLCKRYAPPIGCECKTGYLLAEDGGRCIKPDECPGGNPCGQNATFVGCTFNCPTNYCPVTEGGPMIACSPPYPCPSGCACKKDYKRRSSSDYTCILAKECPPVIKQCSDPNAERVKCAPAKDCRPTCDQRNPGPCIAICIIDDCVCKKGFILSAKDGKCIPEEQCPDQPPTQECGINEHYETNTNKCDLTCKNYEKASCKGCPTSSGCFCNDGYVRNTNGLCIPKKRCPQNIKCPKNEVLSECYTACHKTCKTRIRGDGRMCHTACIETGCLCVEGYLRHDNGTCVPISECSPPQCNENETYSACGTACPPTCQNRGDNCTACTDQCVEDCFCSKGYVRSDDETCVKPKDCPPRTCNDKNEVFDLCPPTCPPTDGCSNIWSKFNCTGAVQCCKPQCRCKSSYFRNDKGICVPSTQC